PQAPSDGLVVQHLGVAARMPRHFRAAAPEALAAVLDGGPDRLAALARARRKSAREDGPVRFRRIARRSARLRPFVVYLDFVPAIATAPLGGLAAWLASLPPGQAPALFSTGAAIFI